VRADVFFANREIFNKQIVVGWFEFIGTVRTEEDPSSLVYRRAIVCDDPQGPTIRTEFMEPAWKKTIVPKFDNWNLYIENINLSQGELVTVPLKTQLNFRQLGSDLFFTEEGYVIDNEGFYLLGVSAQEDSPYEEKLWKVIQMPFYDAIEDFYITPEGYLVSTNGEGQEIKEFLLKRTFYSRIQYFEEHNAPAPAECPSFENNFQGITRGSVKIKSYRDDFEE